MPLLNTRAGYGALPKALHWAIVLLFAVQVLLGLVMVRLPFEGGALGFATGTWYNWHKTLGLVALAVALPRLALRQWGPLPDWAPSLCVRDQRLAHGLEVALYAAMLVLPVTGFLYVMAGGFGVQFAGAFALPNPIGRIAWLAEAARVAHVAGGVLLAAALAGHLWLVLRRRLFGRMWPGGARD
jgi:cytochrome b561